ncbi:MAG: YggT family protein [Pyrinomonadaceae bacterium]|nr:YggT family protein [Pyrinomonadaceae bacterium]
MQIILALYLLIQSLVVAVVIVVILLMLARLALNYADLNPFSRPVMYLRRWTDPLVNPVRRSLSQFGFGPNIAPLVTILIAILVGWFATLLAESILLTTAGGVLRSAQKLPGQQSALIGMIGWVLYGLLDVYSLLIFIRIIFSWGNISYTNRVMRFLVNATDPLLVPLRRMIPPLGMFDLSALVAFILLWLFKAAIAGTLLQFA